MGSLWAYSTVYREYYVRGSWRKGGRAPPIKITGGAPPTSFSQSFSGIGELFCIFRKKRTWIFAKRFADFEHPSLFHKFSDRYEKISTRFFCYVINSWNFWGEDTPPSVAFRGQSSSKHFRSNPRSWRAHSSMSNRTSLLVHMFTTKHQGQWFSHTL